MSFLDRDFDLSSPIASHLFHDYAENMPIIDYHSHLIPKRIADNDKFSSITDLWLSGDHYKWRLMRNCGVDEKYITGDADEYDKFLKFAECMPKLVGNPMYVWCHLELKNYFGYTGYLTPETAKEVYDLCNEKLKTDEFSVRRLIERSRVTALCTTDDPIDTLEYHKFIREDDSFGIAVLPSYRPDKAVHIENSEFFDYIEKLAEISGEKTDTVAGIKKALKSRLDFFVNNGCIVSDHALNDYTYSECTDEEAERILVKAKNSTVTREEAEKYQTNILLFLAGEYKKHNIVMQLHLNCLRNINTVMYQKLGPDTGYDCINNSSNVYKLAGFLNCLNLHGSLGKCVIYSLDPNDDRMIETVINAFQKEGRGQIQHGIAWWFNDTKSGMLGHMTKLAEDSVLGNFIGMLTDSRSFTSYARHEYFRRLLCEFLANQVICGEYPEDEKMLKILIEDICYNNVKNYLGL